MSSLLLLQRAERVMLASLAHNRQASASLRRVNRVDTPLIFRSVPPFPAQQQGTRRETERGLKSRRRAEQTGEKSKAGTLVSRPLRDTDGTTSRSELPRQPKQQALASHLVVGDLFFLSQWTASKKAAFQKRSVCLADRGEG